MSCSVVASCVSDANPPPAEDIDGAVEEEPHHHLLLSEVAISPNNAEFIEIFNPGPDPVDLTNYYISDDADYALLPGTFGAGPVPYVNGDYDFIVKFPDGASIEPGGVRVVALRYLSFTSVFEFAPDFAVAQGIGEVAMVVTDEALISADPQLTNSGEGIVLFYWDGESDLVADVDMVTAGQAPEDHNRLANKTVLRVDGPDLDDAVSTYRPDAYTIGRMTITAEAGQSHKRIAREDGFESRDRGGNGLFGDDETTEEISKTWDSGPLTAPTPGEVPASLL